MSKQCRHNIWHARIDSSDRSKASSMSNKNEGKLDGKVALILSKRVPYLATFKNEKQNEHSPT